MTEREIENALAQMPECQKTLLLWPHAAELIDAQPDWLIAMARITGCIAVDCNVHPRVGKKSWGIEDWTNLEELHANSPRPLTASLNYSPFVGYDRGIDPATVSLRDIGNYACRVEHVAELFSWMPIVTLLDSERFEVHRDEKHVALDDIHNARITTIHNAFAGNAPHGCPVYWYGAKRSLATMTWRERLNNSDSESYPVLDPEYWHKAVEAAEKKRTGTEVVTCWVSLGCGYDNAKPERNWHEDLGYPTEVSRDAGRWLGARNVQIILHPHPLSVRTGVQHLRAFVDGVNEVTP